jgi:hypothetical protein
VLAHVRSTAEFRMHVRMPHCVQTSGVLRTPRVAACASPREMDTSKLNAAIAAIALPALGTELIDPLLSACDTAFVGRIGVEPLAGVGIASAVFTYTFLFFNFLATASSPLVTQALARCDAVCPAVCHCGWLHRMHQHAVNSHKTSCS